MKAYDKLYIDGAWVAPSGKGTLDVINSTTEEVMATIPEGDASDVDRAVKAAKAAFPTWSQTSVQDRAKFLSRINEGLTARADEIANIVSEEVGMPKMLSKLIQVGLPQGSFAVNAQLAEGYKFEEEVGNSLVVKEPVGVVGCITPWNYPLHQIAAKVAPALAAGCTVVLKPSEVAPVNAFILAEIIHDVGLPAGVFNLVSGVGPVVGEAIASHPDVDMVSFTGSTRAGRRVSRARIADGQARHARARRQVGEHHPRRRRLREGRRRRRRQVLPELRPDVLGAHPHAGAARPPRRGRGHRREDRRDLHDRRSVRSDEHASVRSCRRRSASACAATSRRASTKAPRS